jgi:chemotaxis methyl-accepting protein methylase
MASGIAPAQDLSSRPMKIVVPLSAGAADTLARTIGQKITEQTGQPVVVENRPGAGTTLGTDIAARSLEAADRGTFEESDFADTPDELRRRYFAPAPPFTVVPDVRRMVRFERRDLLAEAPPAGPHHLICCRNVLIYFDRETQERLFQKFRDALAPTGFLVLGKVETLLGAARNRFAALDGRERIFRPL